MKNSRYSGLFFLFLGLAIVYALVTLLTPPDARSLNRYGLSSGGAKFLSLTIVVPYIAIWFTAFYGYMKFKKYSEAIEKSKDGKAMSKIADGLLALALSMPIGAVVAALGTAWRSNNPDILPETVIVNNYTNLFLVLIAFYLIYNGAKNLPGVYDTKISVSKNNYFLLGIFAVFSLSYAYLALSDPASQYATADTLRASYYLPDWLLLLTVVIPYIVAWYLGFRSVLYMLDYLANVPGKIYRKSLQYLAVGIFFAVLSIITLRFLTSMTSWFSDQQLKIVLLVLYLLLIVIATGYVFIAKGAKKLQQIEEV